MRNDIELRLEAYQRALNNRKFGSPAGQQTSRRPPPFASRNDRGVASILHGGPLPPSSPLAHGGWTSALRRVLSSTLGACASLHIDSSSSAGGLRSVPVAGRGVGRRSLDRVRRTTRFDSDMSTFGVSLGSAA